MSKKVFIFGAGASKGSQPGVHRDRLPAPVTDELFDSTKYGKYAIEIGLSRSKLEDYGTQLKDSGMTLEAWLTQIWESEIEGKETRPRVRRYRTDFGYLTIYIWWLMQNISKSYEENYLYCGLLKAISDQNEDDFVMINFNYDTLLDRALEKTMGYDLKKGGISCYTENNYFKPHGSVNWFMKKRPEEGNIKETSSRDDGLAFDRIAAKMYEPPPFDTPYIVFPPSTESLNDLHIIREDVFDYQYGYPLILIPLKSKLYNHIIPKLKNDIVEKAKDSLLEATEVFLIGYRAEDEIIKEIFEKVQEGTRLVVVSKSKEGASRIGKNVMEWQTNFKSCTAIGGGFEEFVKNYKKYTGKAIKSKA